MLALGNPLHAFDFTVLHGGQIIVRRAAAGEKLTTLDSVARELTADDLVIADADRAVALAGIMGGEETEIGEATTTVLLEAANFEPYGIFRTSERQKLRTEGSNRWEKGVDPYLAEQAADLATRLLLETAGGTWTADSDVKGELPERPVIGFRPERADEVIGIATPAERQYAILDRLGFDRKGDEVVAPTWRARDVTREIDVVEEIARFRLEDVPFTLPARREMNGALTRDQQLRRRVEDALVGLGLRRDLHAEPAARRRHAVEAPRADLRRFHRPAHVAPPEPRRGRAPKRRRRVTRDRALRDRARLHAGRRPSRGGSDRRRDRRGRLPAREGRCRGAVPRCQGRTDVQPLEPPAPPSGQVGDHRRGHPRRAASARARRRVGGVRARPAQPVRRRGRARSCTTISSPIRLCARTSRSPSARRSRSAISWPRPARQPARSSARSTSSTSTAATRSARARSPLRSRLPIRPRTGRLPRKTRCVCATRSSRRSREKFGAELRG